MQKFKNHLFLWLAVPVLFALPAFAGDTVCLFDEETDFAGKLFRSMDGSVAEVKTGGAFSGERCLNVTPVFRGCEFFYDRMFVWEHGISEMPVNGEYRYVLFAWKKAAGDTVQLAFRDDRSDLTLTYYSGVLMEYRTRANRKYIEIANQLPSGWQYVIRDMYADLEGVQPNFLLSGIFFIAGEGAPADFDCIYLGTSREALEKIVSEIGAKQ